MSAGLKRIPLSNSIPRVVEGSGEEQSTEPEAAEQTPTKPTKNPYREKMVTKSLYLHPAIDEVVFQHHSARRGEKSIYTGRRFKEHDFYQEALEAHLMRLGEPSFAEMIQRWEQRQKS